MVKKRKRRQRKTYKLKALRKKRQLQRSDKINTIFAIIGAVVLAALAVLSFFVIGIYNPIDKEDAVSCSKEFQRLRSYYSTSIVSNYYIEFSNNERSFIPDTYFIGKQNIANDLRQLSPGTVLDFKFHPDGTILEIKSEQKEILNFDYAQKQLFKMSIFIFLVGIVCFLGMVACTVYAMIKIIKYKVFTPSKSVYKRR